MAMHFGVNKKTFCPEKKNGGNHGDIILNRSNNS